MFVVIFNPPILNINLLHCVALVSWVFIFLNWKFISEYMPKKLWMALSFYLFCFMAYLTAIAIINDNSVLSVTVDYIYWIFEIIPFCIYVSVKFMQQGRGLDDLMSFMINVGMVQAILAIIAFLMPTIQTYFVQRLIDYGYSLSLVSDMSYRQYGFAADLSSYAVYYMAAMACLSLFYYIKEFKVSFLAKVIALSFASMINARTGVVIILAGFALALINKGNKKVTIKKILLIALSLVGVPLIIGLVSEGNEDTYSWILSGYTDVVNMLHGDTGGSMSFFYYYKDFWKLPDDFFIFLLGNGMQMMGNAAKVKYGCSSDVGFISDLWKYGIVCSFILYICFFLLIRNCIKKDLNTTSSYLYRLVLVCFFIVNLKGFFFVKQGISTLVLLLVFYLQGMKRRELTAGV